MARKIARPEQLPCLIYPEEPLKIYWDLFMSVLLIWTCMLTPV